MFSYLFLINRTIFVRETSFQQVLLSSSGPKENIFISNLYTLQGVSENIIQNIFIYNIFQYFIFLFVRLMLLSYIVTGQKRGQALQDHDQAKGKT